MTNKPESLRQRIEVLRKLKGLHKYEELRLQAGPMMRIINELVTKLDAAREGLEAANLAYCGVGDFEGTGQNMAEAIVAVRKALKASSMEDE